MLPCEGGTPPECVTRVESEQEAVEAALAWAREGDLLLLVVHAERDMVIERINRMKAEGWTPGA